VLQTFEAFAPRVHETAWVHEGAWVIGEVTLGAEASVWPTAVLRGDMGPIVVGESSNLQDGAICHNTGGVSATRIGARVTVGHRAVLHGCIVEDDCLIGMGAIVMDNAVIGAGSIVGAGAVVLAGRVIPPGSMVLGSPGKVTRAVTDGEREWIAYSWQVYVERARSWRKA
jgi:carbonic anhydrase/acetyltransferase-like protein (isoleucine patch superfamily)